MDFQSVNFVAALALHQHKRDTALGLTHITTKQRGLIWYYNVNQRELFIEASKKAFSYGAIRQAQRRMNEIMAEIHHAKSHDEAVSLLVEAQSLKLAMKDLTTNA